MNPGFRRLTLDLPFAYVHRENEVYWYIWDADEQGWVRMEASDILLLTRFMEKLSLVMRDLSFDQ